MKKGGFILIYETKQRGISQLTLNSSKLIFFKTILFDERNQKC